MRNTNAGQGVHNARTARIIFGKAAFISVLLGALSRSGTKIKRKDVDDYLVNEETYTL